MGARIRSTEVVYLFIFFPFDGCVGKGEETTTIDQSQPRSASESGLLFARCVSRGA